MTSDLALELFGYAASLIIAVSLMMTSVFRLRVLNLVGSAAFMVYAVFIEAWPVVGLNVFIAAINVFFIVKLLRQESTFSMLEADPDSAYLARFLEFYDEDIHRFVPSFELADRTDVLRVFVLRDLVPAGVLIGRITGSALHVDLDYATPGYRDLKIGRYLYGPGAQFFAARGIARFVSRAEVPEHGRYLARVGYVAEGDRWMRPVTR